MVYEQGQRAINIVNVKYIGRSPFVLILHRLGLYDFGCLSSRIGMCLIILHQSPILHSTILQIKMHVLEDPIY